MGACFSCGGDALGNAYLCPGCVLPYSRLYHIPQRAESGCCEYGPYFTSLERVAWLEGVALAAAAGELGAAPRPHAFVEDHGQPPGAVCVVCRGWHR